MKKALFLALLLCLFTLPALAQQPDMDALRDRARHGDVAAQRELVEQLGLQRQAQKQENDRVQAEMSDDAAMLFQGLGVLVGFIFVACGTETSSRFYAWRRQGERVDGAVAGVELHWYRNEQIQFRTVYRYKLSDGNTYAGVSALPASISAKGRETGRAAQLFVFPDKPDVALPADRSSIDIGDALSVLAGVGAIIGTLMAAVPRQSTWWLLGLFAIIFIWRFLNNTTQKAHPFAATGSPPGPVTDDEKRDIVARMKGRNIDEYAPRAQEMIYILLGRRPVYPIEDVLKWKKEHWNYFLGQR